MTRLEELIAALCPDGVELVTLGDVCAFKRGTSITKKDTVNGSVPVIAGGQTPAYYHNEFNRTGETIIVSGSGAYAGFVSYWTIPVFVSDAFTVEPSDGLFVKYVYYFLTSIQECIHETKKGGGVPHVHGSSIRHFKIPLPPLPVQHEIVRILDNFTELTAELTSELAARKKQYNYYRNELLTFGDDIPVLSLREVLQPKGYIRGPFGSALKKEFFAADGTPVYEQQHAIYDSRDFRYYIDEERAKELKRFFVNTGDLIISCSGTIGKISIIQQNDLKGVINQALLILRLDPSKVLTKYVKYYLECFTHLIVCSTGGAITNIEKREIIERIPIPCPSLAEQERIISILDSFEALTTDSTNGLPAEIAARQKQYEYYRDKLLLFKERVA